MNGAHEKLIVEFSLMPASRSQLQRFFDANMERLKADDPDAKALLQIELYQALPKTALDTIKACLSGETEEAVLIHNFPESTGIEKRGAKPSRKEIISYHIGNALFEMTRMHPGQCGVLSRSSHVRRTGLDGGYIHRDMTGDFVALSSPYNGEHAMTQVIQLRRALEEVPESVRRQTQVRIEEGAGLDKVFSLPLFERVELLFG